MTPHEYLETHTFVIGRGHGLWQKWLAALDKADRVAVCALAIEIMPSLCEPMHTRYASEHDGKVICTALRIAAGFYRTIGLITGPLPEEMPEKS